MAPVPVRPGIYKIHAHIIGPTSLVTATEYAVKYGAPVITDRLNPLPIEQEWLIEPFTPEPNAPYVIRLAQHDTAGLIVPEDKLFVNGVKREELAKFHFERVIGGLKILTENDLALRAGHRGAQITVVKPSPEFQETWTLEFISPPNED
ncbi:hypothetical protein ABT104_12320 [Streptomyces mobaraensis]|uniref:hypothetical protein n=1 Tax=Streptomyces mobaraensis TaxID=35621 RepID=UPI0033286974